MSSSVRVDLKNLKRLGKKLAEMDKSRLQVGWFESAKYTDNLPVATVAFWAEFGTKTAPARPFMRPTVAEQQTEWSKIVGQGAKQVLAKDSTLNAVEFLSVFGERVSSDIKKTIAGGGFAPLSMVTIALRKHRNDGVKIGGAFVGAVAAAIDRGETGPGQLGDQSYGNTDPLRDTGFMIATLTSEVS